MAMNNPYQSYQQNAVTTKTPGELTLMLYEGCLKFLRKAKLAIEQKDFEEKNINLQKAQNIISELMITLDMNVEISNNLMALYDYLKHQIVQANMKNDVALIEEVEGFVVEFRDTWKQAIQIYRQQQHPTGGQA